MNQKTITALALDVKGSHKDNPDCPMRLMKSDGAEWYCIDCSRTIRWVRVVAEIKEIKDGV